MPTNKVLSAVMVVCLSSFLLGGSVWVQAMAKDSQRPRARDIGLVVGTLPTGEHNAITDVDGVLVGHATVIREPDIHTGVTAIIPAPGNLYARPVPAWIHAGNGYGKLTGVTQVLEFGEIETPILLTCTLCVWSAADAMKDYLLSQPGETQHTLNPIVGETNDSILSDMWASPVKPHHVRAALESAKGGAVEEGSVGAGTGTQTYHWKGGIGTSSRVLPKPLGGYTVGVLVQSNLLAGATLTMNGAPVGRELGAYAYKKELEEGLKNNEAVRGGSIMIVLATDAPLDSRNLERLASRAMMGLARTGSVAENDSGDYVIAFSTSELVRKTRSSKTPWPSQSLLPSSMSPLFTAVVEATEEAIYNALFKATTVEGRGNRLEALPLDATIGILKKYRVLDWDKSLPPGNTGRSSPAKFELEEASISDIHSAFESAAYSCEQLVSAYIARIEKYDQPTKLNAITLVNPDALSRAQDLDKEYTSTGKLRPLHCIPLIVKDNYDVEGQPTTAGSQTLKNNIASSDAYQVRQLKEAGAIVLARSNMAEWAFSPKVTISSTAGETRNAFNLNYVPAGSSGGTAAAVSANFGTAGLGSDTGNSIRGPSSHNALVGFRSTLGLTSRSGIVPLYLRNDVGGPMTRSVADATRILEVIAGYDPADKLTQHSRGKIPSSYTQYLNKQGLKGARIAVLRTLSEKDADPEVHALFENAIVDLRAAGAEIIDPFVIPGFDRLRENQWCPMFRYDINRYLSSLGDNAPVTNLADIVASGKYSDYIKEDLEYFTTVTDAPQQHEDGSACGDPYSDKHRIAFRAAIEQMMDHHKVGAVIYPSWNNPPAKVGDMDGYKGDNSQVIAPHTGQPAFTVPMGYVTGNLPAGLQFLGRMYDEPTLIRYTYAYEQATRHRNMPKKFTNR